MKIAFEKTENVALKDLNAFQGELKELSKDNYNRLYKQIKKKFTMPFIVWQDKKRKIHILDGHQRLKILNEMKGQGEKLPAKFPCNFIKADSEREAKEILLTFVSQYGRVTDEGLYQFSNENDFDPEFLKDNFNFPGLDLDIFCDGYSKEGEKKQEEKPEVEFAEELLLEHNYIVLYFDNPFDWEVAKEKFGLKKRAHHVNIKGKSIGIGRVVEGKKFL